MARMLEVLSVEFECCMLTLRIDKVISGEIIRFETI